MDVKYRSWAKFSEILIWWCNIVTSVHFITTSLMSYFLSILRAQLTPSIDIILVTSDKWQNSLPLQPFRLGCQIMYIILHLILNVKDRENRKSNHSTILRAACKKNISFKYHVSLSKAVSHTVYNLHSMYIFHRTLFLCLSMFEHPAAPSTHGTGKKKCSALKFLQKMFSFFILYII